ncbi:MAG: undecaprenyldiphospho-muramoylpentapeptide beta-N-acetylglucosaminyltransferase [Alphaproteobacteria bacterium]|nr:undecaprenyldiphospho-muramoylpentapeptide beta-N-acetylglucosaminyltransferase [Alphaproteobacteria bacterium]
MTGSFVLAAGGTGGHLFPAEALARELLSRGARVHLVTDERADAFGGRVPGIEVKHVRAGRFGGTAAQTLRGFAEMAAGAVQARRLLRRLSPLAVIGFGGYPSLPTMLAAASLRLPTMIHEQNAVLGRANRLLAPLTRQIATGFARTEGLRAAYRARAVHTGNPIRPAFIEAGRKGYSVLESGKAIELLILGGSQGARVMGEIVPTAVMTLPSALRERLRISQQVRQEDLAAVLEIYRRGGLIAELNGFFDDVPERLARAHLVICRAGASTVAELSAVGRPALLIPYPHATADHQTANARALAEAGGGWVLPQSGLSPKVLAARVEELLADGSVLAIAARRARAFGRSEATEYLAQLAVSLDRGAVRRPELTGCA